MVATKKPIGQSQAAHAASTAREAKLAEMAKAQAMRGRMPDRQQQSVTSPRTPERLPEEDDGIIRTRSGQPVYRTQNSYTDKFFIPPEIIPSGWDYQWKRKKVFNWEDTNHQVSLAKSGWEAVPASRHDGIYMPKGWDGPIELDGLLLMERDMRLTLQDRGIEQQQADAPLAASRGKAGLQGLMPASGITDFSHEGALRQTGFRKTKGPVTVNVANRPHRYELEE